MSDMYICAGLNKRLPGLSSSFKREQYHKMCVRLSSMEDYICINRLCQYVLKGMMQEGVVPRLTQLIET